MLHLRPLAIGLLALASFAVTSAMADPAAGKLVFERRCAECHGPGFGHPGTQQLGWTRGVDHAVLERRSDLTAAYINLVVRNGLMEMPAFRPTEISDAQLQQLDAYLSSKTQ